MREQNKLRIADCGLRISSANPQSGIHNPQSAIRNPQLRTSRVAAFFRALHSDSGTVSLTFMLSFPIFLTIMGIVVQYALLINAKLIVAHAAQTAARSAATALPDGQPDAVWRAARISLAPLSPKAPNVTDEATAVADALTSCGVPIPPSFAQRYAYAMDATKVSWNGGDWSRSAGREVEVTVKYEFLLTVPGAARILSLNTTTTGGVTGRFWTIGATGHAQASDGRKAPAHGDGWPWVSNDPSAQ